MVSFSRDVSRYLSFIFLSVLYIVSIILSSEIRGVEVRRIVIRAAFIVFTVLMVLRLMYGICICSVIGS